MYKLLVLLFAVSCGLNTNQTDKKTGESKDGYTAPAPESDLDANGDHAIADPENIDLAGLLADEKNVAAAKAMFDGFKGKIIEFAKPDIPDIEEVDFDDLFDKVIAVAKTTKAKNIDGIIDELEPKVMEIIEADPILGKKKNLKIINEKKPLFIGLAKVLGPKILTQGLDAVDLDKNFPLLLK